MKIIISGGGSGGHIFPAIAIAQELKRRKECDILFVGAKGKIEMEKVPMAGFKIEGLWISGLHRGEVIRNLLFPFKLIYSLLKAKKIIEKFKPDVVIGVGGFASGPVLKMAQRKGIKTLIQEQNSYPGITNKLLAKDADKICVAYPNMDRFFSKDKIVLTGNPVRKDLLNLSNLREEALDYFDLDSQKKTILIFGGSLGARSLNEAIKHNVDQIKKLEDIQVIWQVGKVYFDDIRSQSDLNTIPHLNIMPFIDRMDLAYSVADLIICRAGALTISEMSLVAKPCVFVPSPNVAEDHQTKNAQALVDANAAIIVRDSEAKEKLFTSVFKLKEDIETQKVLSQNIKTLAKSNASELIGNEILKLVGNES